ncbi:MAG: hypothetical protein C0506_03695 [Anaerolinea sp.]|nr:hypothetical protein [Anaerolinea sp.]
MARSAADEPDLRLMLTPRQEEIIRLIQRGLTNGQIAELLGLSLDGVKWHVREILARLDVESREEAVAVWQDQHRATAWAKRVMRGLVPLGVGLRIGVAGTALTGAVVGGGMIIAALSSPGGSVGPAGAVGDAVTSPTSVFAATAFPTADPATACVAGDLLIGGDSRVEGGAVVSEFRITKPRGCDLTGPIEAFVVEDASAGFQGARLLTDRTGLVAPVGTDRVFVTVTWRNWCRPVPTPAPTAQRVPGAIPDLPPPNPVWMAWSATSGINTGALYPTCESPALPTTLSLATRAEPDPPIVPTPIVAAPQIVSPADLDPFARWFATVVGARDEAALSVLAKPMDVTCPVSVPSGPDQRFPLCKEAVAGQVRSGFVMSQSGQLGSEEPFKGRLNQVTAGSGNLRTAGCAVDTLACERFVVVFEALPASGPGSYQAFVFEAIQGVAILRGIYPGGGDRGTVFAGGTGNTPWGEVVFVPLR